MREGKGRNLEGIDSQVLRPLLKLGRGRGLGLKVMMEGFWVMLVRHL